MDQQLTDNHKLMGRFVRNVRTQTKGDAAFPFPASPPGDFGYKHWRNNYGAALTWTAVISPTSVWDNRFGWVRHPFGLKRPGDEFDPSALGFPQSLVARLPRLTFPGIAVTAYATLTAAESPYTTTDTHPVASTRNRVADKHSLKTGVEFRVMRYNLQMPISNFGTFSFTRAFTQLDALRAEAAAGNAVASFQLGYPASASLAYNIAAADLLQPAIASRESGPADDQESSCRRENSRCARPHGIPPARSRAGPRDLRGSRASPPGTARPDRKRHGTPQVHGTRQDSGASLHVERGEVPPPDAPVQLEAASSAMGGPFNRLIRRVKNGMQRRPNPRPNSKWLRPSKKNARLSGKNRGKRVRLIWRESTSV